MVLGNVYVYICRCRDQCTIPCKGEFRLPFTTFPKLPLELVSCAPKLVKL